MRQEDELSKVSTRYITPTARLTSGILGFGVASTEHTEMAWKYRKTGRSHHVPSTSCPQLAPSDTPAFSLNLEGLLEMIYKNRNDLKSKSSPKANNCYRHIDPCDLW